MSQREEVTEVKSTRTARFTTCELCGTETREDEWNRELYEHDEVTISNVHKTHYPESGSTEGEAFDCCPKCFGKKVRPLLLGLGMKPRIVDLGY